MTKNFKHYGVEVQKYYTDAGFGRIVAEHKAILMPGGG